MKVFISWSGNRSKYVAEALHEWLPKVLQAVKPWISSEDIAGGTRWGHAIAEELEQTTVGIVCLTPENQHSPWIMFESGALAKKLEKTYVCPYLLDLTPAEVSGPLSLFHSNQADKNGTYKIVKTMNDALVEFGSGSVGEINDIFEVWWPRLSSILTNIPDATDLAPIKRSQDEILSEILENSRELVRRDDIRLSVSLEKDEMIKEMVSGFENLLPKRTSDLGLWMPDSPIVQGIHPGIDNFRNIVGSMRTVTEIGEKENEQIHSSAKNSDPSENKENP